MQLSIVIVNWNSVQHLGPCLDALRRCTHGVQYEVIVIDSASYDGSHELVTRNYPWARFIQSSKNIGFAAANNLACRNAVGEYVLFLNPDTLVTQNAIASMLNNMRKLRSAGAVGVRLLNSDGTLQTSCVQRFPTVFNQLLSSDFLRSLTPRAALWGLRSLVANATHPVSVDVISGACIMLRREAFEQVGGFSEEYFMYAEDLDLCHKLRQAAYVNYCLPQVSVVHHGGGSSERAPSEFAVVMMRESIWRFLAKSRGTAYAEAYRVSVLMAAVVRLFLLALAYPVRRAAVQRGPMRKWSAILAWSLRLRRPVIPAS